jgi:adenylate cyclase
VSNEEEQPDVSPFDRVREIVASDPKYTLAEVAEQAGLPLQILRQVFATTDWDDQPGYDDRDVAYAEAAARILDHYPLDAVIRTLRTRHRAMTSIVVSDLGTVRDEIVTPALAHGAGAQDLVDQLGRTGEEILPLVTSQLAEDYRHVLIRLLDTDAVAEGASLEGGREIQLAVGFVDVVGFTSLSGQVDPAGLDHVLKGFEDLVSSAVAEAEDVLLAKFIGDAAMIVSSDAVKLTDILLRLVEDDRRLAEAPRRAGMACGPVLVREGDYYGPIPNLAARLTDYAREWSLLAAEELEEALEADFELTVIPETTIHGVGERTPLRVRRIPDG